MQKTAEAFIIDTPSGQLAAIYHAPAGPARKPAVGCLVLVGGPQYRVGAHRQYVNLARRLSQNGIGVLRFDYNGMGDSDGNLQPIEDRGDSIEAASQALLERLGQEAKIFPWGLCEGASAIFMHHRRIANLAGAIIANPWVGDAEIEAQVRWRRYYFGRFNAKYLLRRLRSGRFLGRNVFENTLGFFRGAQLEETGDDYTPGLTQMPSGMRELLARNTPVLYLASAEDRESQTFEYALKSNEKWQAAYPSKLMIRTELAGADHTFSNSDAKNAVAALTFRFIDTQTKPISLLSPASVSAS